MSGLNKKTLKKLILHLLKENYILYLLNNMYLNTNSSVVNKIRQQYPYIQITELILMVVLTKFLQTINLTYYLIKLLMERIDQLKEIPLATLDLYRRSTY
jgi:hypothetical protein